MLADYAGEIRTPAGRVDAPRLVARLKHLGVNTYAFLILHAPTDYEDLGVFCRLAAAAGVETWAYLVPPAEAPSDYPPCQTDYRCWGEAVGLAAKECPALTALVMDDFAMAPEVSRAMLASARLRQPGLLFYPVAYAPLGGAYVDHVDGVIVPHTDLDRPDHRATLRRVCRGWPACFVMIYAAATSWHPEPPTEGYLARAVSNARDAARASIIQGIVLYALDKSEASLLFGVARAHLLAFPRDGQP